MIMILMIDVLTTSHDDDHDDYDEQSEQGLDLSAYKMFLYHRTG